jgi:hypothetical protein
MFLQVCKRCFLGHLCGRDLAGGAAQLAGWWWPWLRSCRCRRWTTTSAAATPHNLLFRPPCLLYQELRGVRAPLPRPGWRRKAAYAVTCPHRGGCNVQVNLSDVGLLFSIDPWVICGLVLLITRANQTFTNLLMRSELCLGVVDHILM